MNPPYDITPEILKLIASISEKIGKVGAAYLDKASPQLRKRNRIKTIQASLQIEGNTLTEEQITALIENRRVVGPKTDVLEVMNAIGVYNHLNGFRPTSEKSFLSAHAQLMRGLITNAGRYRNQGVGIIKRSRVAHVAPPAKKVPILMKQLFDYLKGSKDLVLIKSCVFHYEVEFIHPFLDGNGRMGRLWQTLILAAEYPVFEFLPFETLISKSQTEYYKALAKSDKAGNSSAFIGYMLGIIDKSLAELSNYNNRSLTDLDRIQYFVQLEQKEFSRKDYMNVFKDISSATASRDLKKGIDLGFFRKSGKRNKTVYRVK